MGHVFKNGKLELLAMTETKLKGKGKLSWCGVNGLIAVVQEMKRAREGAAIMLNDVWHRAVVHFGCVSSRIFWIKFKFSMVKICVVVWYSHNEGDGEERVGYGTTLIGLWIA